MRYSRETARWHWRQTDNRSFSLYCATGLKKSLELSDSQFGLVISIFFALYVVAQTPLVVFGKWLGPRRALALYLLCFGTISMCQAASTSFAGLLVVRAFLGLGALRLTAVAQPNWMPPRPRHVRC